MISRKTEPTLLARVSFSLHEKLRAKAFEKNRSMREVMDTALTEYLKKIEMEEGNG